MAKITLGNKPKNFPHEVTFPMLDGTQGVIEILFKYRTRKEYGAFVDEWKRQREAQASADVQAKLKAHEAAAQQAKEAGAEVPALELLTQTEMQAAVVDGNADYILQIADGWNLDFAFSRENLQQLCDEEPSAGPAIVTAYRAALTEARLGN